MMAPFRAPAQVRYFGDAASLARLRPLARRELQRLHRENVLDLDVYTRTLALPSGERIVCRRVGALDMLDLHAAPRRETTRRVSRERPAATAPKGSFYAIPECLARYEGLTSLVNAIPDGSLAGWTVGLGQAVERCPRAAAGLPAAQGLSEAGLDREVAVFTLPGGAGSGLLFGRAHIPDAAPFSVSCLVRLNAPLDYDYTYDARGLFNPFRTYFLQSEDGQTFSWDCPGAISPVLGFCSPHGHPDWSETVTYPWAPWNSDYASHVEHLVGAKRMEASPCPGAPLLVGDDYRDATGQDYPYPYGFILGLQAAGLFLYGDNRLLGARISHFESQLGHTPVLTDPLEYGLWHHVVLTHDADGAARIYLARQDRDTASVYSGEQPLCTMDEACQYTFCGVNAWTLHNGDTGADIGAYRMNPTMDVALPRFFHYALSASQAYLLQQEALDGLFVADDHELGPAMAAGLTPIILERETA